MDNIIQNFIPIANNILNDGINFKIDIIKGVLTIIHCDCPCEMMASNTIALKCYKCNYTSNLSIQAWSALNIRYQQYLTLNIGELLSQKIDAINVRLEKLEKTTYDTTENRALQLIKEAQDDIKSLEK